MALTEKMQASGGKLVELLDQVGLAPTAAFWFQLPDDQGWRLLLAEKSLVEEGPRAAYLRLRDVIDKSGEVFEELSLDDISIVPPNGPLVALMSVALQTGPDGINGIRFTNNTINGTLIDDAYIYRLARPTDGGPVVLRA